jgi:predicted nuclease of predicted toxin-antitoxin system
MKLLIDMNLSPDWVEVFAQQGWAACHWSTVGNLRATDRDIMDWARAHSYVVFTHDLDFGILLATTRAQGPSVVQMRTQDIMPQSLGSRLVNILQQYESVLESGALITVDEIKSRVRMLPFQ